MQKKHTAAIIAAGGRGSRMGTDISKQYMMLGGKPVISYSLEKLQVCSIIDEIVVVVSDDDKKFFHNNILAKNNFSKISSITLGGKNRQSSVYNGLRCVNKKTDIVLIHDAARPLIKINDIETLIADTMAYPCCALGVPVKDTIKQTDESGFAINTPDRQYLYAVQTPQAFAYNFIIDAHEKALKDGFTGTDDTMLAEYAGVKAKITLGSYSNIKITTHEDLIIAEALLYMDR